MSSSRFPRLLNALITHSHHGSVKKKSTQSLVSELHDSILQDLTHVTETAILILDQSKAYDVVSHVTLIRKLRAIGFLPQAIMIMTSFLDQ